jgi:hypothetical protein
MMWIIITSEKKRNFGTEFVKFELKNTPLNKPTRTSISIHQVKYTIYHPGLTESWANGEYYSDTLLEFGRFLFFFSIPLFFLLG